MLVTLFSCFRIVQPLVEFSEPFHTCIITISYNSKILGAEIICFKLSRECPKFRLCTTDQLFKISDIGLEAFIKGVLSTCNANNRFGDTAIKYSRKPLSCCKSKEYFGPITCICFVCSCEEASQLFTLLIKPCLFFSDYCHI